MRIDPWPHTNLWWRSRRRTYVTWLLLYPLSHCRIILGLFFTHGWFCYSSHMVAKQHGCFLCIHEFRKLAQQYTNRTNLHLLLLETSTSELCLIGILSRRFTSIAISFFEWSNDTLELFYCSNCLFYRQSSFILQLENHEIGKNVAQAGS